MNDITQTLIRSLLKVGAGMLVAQGLIGDTHVETIVGGLMALIGVIWGVMHRSPDAATPPAPANLGQAPKLIILGAVLALGATGCQVLNIQGRVVAISETVKGVAIDAATEASLTPRFRLGLVHTRITIVPVTRDTNQWMYVPAVVDSLDSDTRLVSDTTSSDFATGRAAEELTRGTNSFPWMQRRVTNAVPAATP